MNRYLKLILSLLIISNAADAFSQADKANIEDRKLFITFYKGIVTSYSTEVIKSSPENYSDSSSRFTATGVGLGYSFNPAWTFEVQYQYVAQFNAIANKAVYRDDQLKDYEIKHYDNKVKLDVYYYAAMFKRNYFIHNFSNGKIFFYVTLGYGQLYYDLLINDGGEITRKRNTEGIGIVSPAAVAYQYQNWEINFHLTSFYGFGTSQLGIGYYFW